MLKLKPKFILTSTKHDIAQADNFYSHKTCLIATMLRRRGVKNFKVGGFGVTIEGQEFRIRIANKDDDVCTPERLGYVDCGQAKPIEAGKRIRFTQVLAQQESRL